MSRRERDPAAFDGDGDEGDDLAVPSSIPAEVAAGVDVDECQKVLLTAMRTGTRENMNKAQIARLLLDAAGRLGANVKGTRPEDDDPDVVWQQVVDLYNDPLLDRFARPKKPRTGVTDPNRIHD